MAELISERHISRKAFLLPMVAAGVFALAVLGFRLMAGSGSWLFWLPLAILPTIAVLLYAKMIRVSTAYRLFPDRLEVASGLFTRSIENVDLFRIRDLGVRQGIYGRIANFGDLYLHSTDSSTPDLHIRGIDAPEAFYRQMRELVEASRAQRQTMIVEETRPIPE
jgi:membrane protein YdbS with pleckstrin-like domain